MLITPDIYHNNMQSKLVGGWLISLSAGTLGLITWGGYTRLKRAGLSMVEWKPLSIWYPTRQNEWEAEYSRYKEFPEYQQNPLDIEDFKEIYFIEYAHRVYARFLGLCLVVPMAVFWKKGILTSSMKTRLLGITGLFGLQGALGWIMVRSGLQHKEYDGRVKVEPISLATHLFCGVGLYSLIFYTGVNCFRKTPETVINTVEKLGLAKIARRKYMALLHLSLLTVFSGGLVAGSDAGKILNNWPFFGDDYFFPENALTLNPVYTNFYESKEMIQFVHRTLGYLTYGTAINLWFYVKGIKAVLPYAKNAHLILLISTYQVVLGITTLMRGSPIHESLTHQTNALFLLSTIMFGLSSFRKPNKIFIDKLLGK